MGRFNRSREFASIIIKGRLDSDVHDVKMIATDQEAQRRLTCIEVGVCSLKPEAVEKSKGTAKDNGEIFEVPWRDNWVGSHQTLIEDHRYQSYQPDNDQCYDITLMPLPSGCSSESKWQEEHGKASGEQE